MKYVYDIKNIWLTERIIAESKEDAEKKIRQAIKSGKYDFSVEDIEDA